MNIKLTALLLLLVTKIVSGQISVAKGGLINAKEYSKEISLYKAKTFIISEIIGQGSSAVIQFEIDWDFTAKDGIMQGWFILVTLLKIYQLRKRLNLLIELDKHMTVHLNTY